MIRGNRNAYPKFTTGAAPSVFPSLNEPDYKFKKDTGEYHARLRVSVDADWVPALVAEAEAVRDEEYDAKVAELTKAKKAGLIKDLVKKPILTEEVDPETGDPTGFYIFRAALPARVDIKNGPKAGTSFEKKPDIFDARGNHLQKPPEIGSGSTLKLSGRIFGYAFQGKEFGARFELEAAQVIKLVQGGQRTAGNYGFGEEDGDDLSDAEPAPRKTFGGDNAGTDEHDDL